MGSCTKGNLVILLLPWILGPWQDGVAKSVTRALTIGVAAMADAGVTVVPVGGYDESVQGRRRMLSSPRVEM